MSKQEDKIVNLLMDDSFLRWVNKENSGEERLKWEKWLQEDPDNIIIAQQAKDFSGSMRFETENPDTKKELRKLKKEHNEKNVSRYGKALKKSYLKYWIQAAAVTIFIAIFVVLRYTNWKTTQQQDQKKVATKTVQTDYGESKKITLADGSQITLNGHSKLIYPSSYKNGEVNVRLQGEAYFSIVHKYGDQQRTFSVNTPQGKISVLGTKFNVNAYSKNTKVVLESGNVHVEMADTLGMTQRSYTMKPGDLALLNFTKHDIQVKQVDTELYTSWKEHKLKFKDTSLKEIGERIEDIYGKKVVFRSDKLKQVKFSGTAPDQNLRVLLEGLKTLLNIPIVQNNKTITIGK